MRLSYILLFPFGALLLLMNSSVFQHFTSFCCKWSFLMSRIISLSVVLHVKKPLNQRCHLGTYWIIPVVCLHSFYVASLVGFTRAIRHVEFRFDEVKDLWQGILVSASCIGTFFSQFYSRHCNWFSLSSMNFWSESTSHQAPVVQ